MTLTPFECVSWKWRTGALPSRTFHMDVDDGEAVMDPCCHRGTQELTMGLLRPHCKVHATGLTAEAGRGYPVGVGLHTEVDLRRITQGLQARKVKARGGWA